MRHLTDGERDVIREQEADARGCAEFDPDAEDVYESAGCLEDVLDYLLADDRETVCDPGELCDDSEYPF